MRATPPVPRRFPLPSSSRPEPDPASVVEAENARKLQGIVDSALAHLELEALLDQLLLRVQEALEVDTCVILLLDEQRNELVATAARGLEEEVERGVRVPVGRGFAGRVASERQPVVIDDLEKADIVNPLLREKGLKALLGAPLLARDQVLGVVHVGSLEPREFTLADIDLLQLAASRMALAIGHSRAFEAERRARAEVEASRERLTRLQSVTDAALAHLELDELLSELAHRICGALDVDTCAILLLDEERNELVARAARGLEEEVERGVRIPVGKGFAGRVASRRQPVVLDDVDHADVLNPILRQKRVKSMIGAPLLTRGRVLGVVHVGSLTQRRFMPGDVELLQLAADRAALGLERAIVHEQLLRLEDMKQDFVATAAHELRTPASVLIGIAATFHERRDSLSDETKTQLLDLLYDASTRLGHLLEELLDFSRVESRMLVPDQEPVALRPLVDDVAREVAPSGFDGLQNEVPEDASVVSDVVVLRRVVANLLKNSLLHGRPPVRVRFEPRELEAVLTVEDRGPGVPKSFVARLFDPFARASAADGKPGAGLGLAIASSYARRVGGELSYENAEPTGARFRLRLPQPVSSAHP